MYVYTVYIKDIRGTTCSLIIFWHGHPCETEHGQERTIHSHGIPLCMRHLLAPA